MKITNKDICRKLKELDGQDWQFGFRKYWSLCPLFYVKGDTFIDLFREFKTHIPFNLFYTSRLERPLPGDDKIIQQLFENFDWREAYQNSTFTLEYDPYHERACRVFERKSDIDGFKLFFTSTRLEKAVENAVKEQMKFALTSVENKDIVNGTVKIPEKTNFIKKNAFKALTDLKTITIPRSVVRIENSAFNCCPNLEKIVFSSPNFSIDENAFYKCDKLKEIYLPVCSDPQVIIQATEKLKRLKNYKNITAILYVPKAKASKEREL